jgi:hypothetical protein
MALRASPARPDVAYDALRAALAAAEVVRREQLASHGQLVCTDFRINAAVAAAAAAMRAHPSHAFRDSPGLALLDAHGSLRLVTDLVHEDDALCLALACRALRDALWARFPQSKVFSEMSEDSQSEAESEAEFGSEKSPPAESPGHRLFRFCTRDAAVVATVPRLLWARGLRDRPPWLPGAEAWRTLVQINTHGGRKICETIARAGGLAALQWVRANGCNWDEDTCSAAARGGHLAVLQWARANGCEWDEYTCRDAARGGHLAVLQWARANGCDWDEETCRDAAAGGHLAVLHWARVNDCDWDTFTCSAAAGGGHLAVLQWARANGCDWNRAECLTVAPAGSETREWIQAQPA